MFHSFNNFVSMLTRPLPCRPHWKSATPSHLQSCRMERLVNIMPLLIAYLLLKTPCKEVALRFLSSCGCECSLFETQFIARESRTKDLILRTRRSEDHRLARIMLACIVRKSREISNHQRQACVPSVTHKTPRTSRSPDSFAFL